MITTKKIEVVGAKDEQSKVVEEPVKVEETVIPKVEETKPKKSWIAKLKDFILQLEAESVPGVPGTTDAKGEDTEDDDEECECSNCKGTGKVKKEVKKEEPKKDEVKKEQAPAAPKLEVKNEPKIEVKEETKLPKTNADLMALFGMSPPPVLDKSNKEFHEICEAFRNKR